MIIQIEPMGKPRMTQRDKWKKRPVVLRYFAFRDTIKSEIYKSGVDLKNVVGLNMKAYFSMPRTWSKKKKRELQGKYHQQRSDLDNILKGVLDSIFEEDSVIAVINAEKRWDDINGPRIELDFIYQEPVTG